MITLNPNTALQGGKYRILRTLGQGGFGITYLAEQTMLYRKVCIKEFFLMDCCKRNSGHTNITLISQANKTTVQQYLLKFLKEARTISQLHHPNIIKIHDVFEENNTAYYVMDYIEGENLNQLVRRLGPLPEATAVQYIRKIASSLTYIHSLSINHLDVKPGNIMLNRIDGQITLIDFGLSKQYDSVGSQTSTAPVGMSNGYAPIEQYYVGGVAKFSPQTDIYSLGATLYWLVTGQKPPIAQDVLNQGLPSLPSHLSTPVQNAIKAAMKARRTDRPESVEKWCKFLNPSSPFKFDISMDRNTLIVAMAFVFAALVAGLIAFDAISKSKKYGQSVDSLSSTGIYYGTNNVQHAEKLFYEDPNWGGYYWTGDVINNIPNGMGIAKSDLGLWEYKGRMESGRFDGSGTLLLNDGSYYVGTFKDGEYDNGNFYNERNYSNDYDYDYEDSAIVDSAYY